MNQFSLLLASVVIVALVSVHAMPAKEVELLKKELARLAQRSGGCSPNPCQRGAACFTGENPNGWGGYCQCPYPSGGFYCEIANPCSDNPCPFSQTCVRLPTQQLGRICY